MTRPRFFQLSILIITIIIAFYVFLLATSNGIGVLPDSITYLSTAKNLVSGNGFYAVNEPMTHYPPLYPILLTLGEIFSQDAVSFARFIHAFIYSFNATLFCYIIFLTTKKNYMAMLLGSVIFITSKSVLSPHVYVLSEPLFLTFSLLATLFLYMYFSKPTPYLLFLIGVALSMAVLTRYFGVTLIPPVLLVLFIFDQKPLRKKIYDQITIICLALIPVIIWIIRNALLTQSAVNRTFEAHLIDSQKLLAFIDVFHFFFWANDVPIWRDTLDLIILFALISLLIIKIFQAKKNGIHVNVSNQVNISFGIIFTFFYVVLLIFSISFVDPNTPVDVRLLMPVFVIIMISLLTAFCEFFRVKKYWYLPQLFGTVVMLMVLHNIPILRNGVINFSEGIAFNSPSFEHSQTIQAIKEIDRSVSIYTNAVDLIYFKTGIWGNWFPSKVVGSRLLDENDFIDSIRLMCNEAEKNNALIVCFNPVARWYHPTVREIIEYCDIPILFQFEDGTIFGILK